MLIQFKIKNVFEVLTVLYLLGLKKMYGVYTKTMLSKLMYRSEVSINI